MSTRRQRELLLSKDQALYVEKALDTSVRRVIQKFLAKSTIYNGASHDNEIVQQVLRGIVYELHRDLESTLGRISRRFIP